MSNVYGLKYIPDFLDESREAELLGTIDAQPWLDDLKRRVQHYGYKYDYTKKIVDTSMSLGPLPGWAASLAIELVADGLFPKAPDQLIINEYLPGQGIFPHIDCKPCFDETIASISLASGCVMDFVHIDGASEASIFLEPRSIIVMTGEARYDWRHSIAPRTADNFNGQVIERSRRVSMTFRNVLVQ
jgi:alkylated DNA repair dioxygenase AlkB